MRHPVPCGQPRHFTNLILDDKGAVGGRREHDAALDGLAADGAVADELGARLAHGAVAAGPRHHHPRLRHADDALARRTLLGRR